MINAQELLSGTIQKALQELYSIHNPTIVLQKTRKEFEGDFTLVTFAFTKESKRQPDLLGKELGEYLLQHNNMVSGYNVVKGFLNVSLSDTFWISYFNSIKGNTNLGIQPANSSGRTVMVEYSSPNTNKPLHLGHVRNILLGYSVAQILRANGHKVLKVNLVNDRGIHICKSMLAWQKFGNGETPQSSGMKGDHLVGKYYVEFEKRNQIAALGEFKRIIKNKLSGEKPLPYAIKNPETNFVLRYAIWLAESIYNENQNLNFKEICKELAKKEIPKETETNAETLLNLFTDYFSLNNPLIDECREMLRQWEANNPEVVNLWKTMNGWVYEGFDKTYGALGVGFDKTYYESNTYLLGKEIVQEGLAKNVFYRKDNGSVAIDLSKDGLDEKIVLRSDGTSVYITQDMGTAIERFKEFPGLNQLIYTVGNEQDYHFKVLFKILEKLGYDWAKECYHLSYGMVELPEGKMKSREGTVVDADELLKEMVDAAAEATKALGKVEDFTETELEELYKTLGLGALKYFILKVDPKKKMLFDPKESIDLHGNTGPFIQYTYARISSVLRKAGNISALAYEGAALNHLEKEMVKWIYDFEETVKEAGKTYSPALLANYAFELTKLFNRFYHEHSILNEPDEKQKNLRLHLSASCANVIANCMNLMGITVPERM